MKHRALTLILATALTLSVSACGEDPKVEPAKKSTNAAKPQVKEELTPAQKKAAKEKEIWRSRRYRYSVTEVAGNHVRVVPKNKGTEASNVVTLTNIVYACHAIRMEYESHVYITRSFGDYQEDDWADVTCKKKPSTKSDKPASTTPEKAR